MCKKALHVIQEQGTTPEGSGEVWLAVQGADWRKEMKHGKNPTVKQKKLMQKWGLNAKEWLVCKDTSTELVVVHRHTDTVRTIGKEQNNDR